MSYGETFDGIRDDAQASLGFMESQGVDRDTVAGHTENLSTAECIRLMNSVKQAYEAVDEKKKVLGKVYDHLRTVTVPERMDDEGIGNMRVDGVGQCKLTSDMYVSVQDKSALFRWLEGQGLEDLVQEQVNAQQLKSKLRKLMENGEEVPNDYVKITPFTRASITK